MMPALLIAGNFLRENRWPVILLILWGVGSGVAGALSVGSSVDDALFFLKQQAVYSVFFTVFLSASALYNQRRSRRILAVLSKGIERYEYLAGIVVGFSAVSFFYSLALGVTGAWTFTLVGSRAINVLPLAVMLLLASVLAGTVALFFSTFMNPLFTLMATSVALGFSAVFGNHIPSLLPAYTLLESVMGFTFRGRGEYPWIAALWAVLETVLLWVAASVIFARKDIAVSVE
jgi:ABC-type transport system involved in multi-copper enzyme maturation permease subunit